jgi:orotate phosphoribosyltransferase
MSTAIRERLRQLLLSRAVSFGKFTLASGRESNFYINSKKVLFHSECVSLIADALWEKLAPLDIQAVGGLEVGAIPLAAAVVYRAHQAGRELEGFFVRKQPKGHGTQERIEGLLPPRARVAILDDVLTTGSSALQAVNEVERAGGVVVAVACIVDREEGARDVFIPRYEYLPLFTLTDLGIKKEA